MSCDPMWCVDHKRYDYCFERDDGPGPFDHLPPTRERAAPELSIYEAPTEKTIVGVPPAPPIVDEEVIETWTDEEIAAAETPRASDEEMASRTMRAKDRIAALSAPKGAAPAVEIHDETAKVQDFRQAAAVLDTATFEAQKAALAAMFEAMLAEGIPAGTCNKLLFKAVEKLGLKPTGGDINGNG